MPSKKKIKPKKIKKKSVQKKAPKKKRPVEESRSIAEQVLDAGLILEACGNDEEVAQFFLVWLQNGRNATKAIMAIHPEYKNEHTASVVGSRLLGRVDKSQLAKAYGISYEAYFNQLRDGMNAMKGKNKPDHKVRRDYHKAAGEILGIEQKSNGNNTAVQVNIGKAINDWIATE